MATGTDDGVRVVVRAADLDGRAAMTTLFDHGNLVTPWLVRHAIERAIASGWDPTAGGRGSVFRIEGKLEDRRVAVGPPVALAATEEELIDRIADAEDAGGAADEERAVYADWLLERGDPRGEFIALATAIERGIAVEPEQRARHAELAAQCTRWLGPIADVTTARTWRHGMFDGCQLSRRATGAIDRALGHPAWATVRAIDAQGAFMTEPGIAQLVAQPQLRSLRALVMSYKTARAAVEQVDGFRRLREVAIPNGGAHHDVLGALAARMVDGGRLVAHVNNAGVLAALLAESRLAEIVVIDVSFEKFATWLPAIAEVASAHVRRITFARDVSGHVPYGGQFELRRGADGRWSALTICGVGGRWVLARDWLLGALDRVDPRAFTAATLEAGEPFDDVLVRRAVVDRLQRQRAFQDFGIR